MPGLFGCADAAASVDQLTHIGDRMCSLFNRQRDPRRFAQKVVAGAPFVLGYHSIRRFISHKGIAQSDSWMMALDGILFEPSPAPDMAQLLTQYRRQGTELVKTLRGNFALAVCDSQSGDFYLYTDHAATRPIYYTIQDGALYFAGDYVALSATLPHAGHINPQAVVDMLTFGYLAGNKTPRESVFCMPPGSCLHWNAHTTRLEIKPYFVADNTPADASYSEMRDELQNLFVQAVERTLRGTKPLFTLSGGLDSRAVLGAALQFGVEHPDSLTFGEPISMDVKLALQVARKAQAQAILVSLGDGDYLVDTFEAASRYNGGMVYYSGSAHMLHALQRLDLERWDIVQTGMSGDMLMGSFLRQAETIELVDNRQALAERIAAKLGYLTWIERLTVDDTAARRLVYDSIRDSLAEPRPAMTVSQALELWNLHNRQQRAMFNGFRVIENFAEYVSPFFDADLYPFVLSIPHRYRLGEAIYVDMLSRLLPPSIWKIPWQKTGRPPSTRAWVNKINAWSNLWTGRAMRALSSSTRRRRSMNPMGAWLRDNARLRRFAVERLLAWDSPPSPLERPQVHKFAQDIAEARIGISPRIPALLFRLLTLTTWMEKHAR